MNQNFKRDLGQLSNVFSFLDNFADEVDIAMPIVLPVRLAIEELFTNMVRHNSAAESDITISLDRDGDNVVVVLTDLDVAQPFDPTQHKEVDTNADLKDRDAGGLGIHLVKRMVDEVHYHYSSRNRQSRVTLIKSVNSQHA
jgi:anti-sigma regulatory factor (Ser/Thr protein kinase)